MPYHGERHAVNLVFVFGLVLSEGTVPAHGRQRDKVRVRQRTKALTLKEEVNWTFCLPKMKTSPVFYTLLCQWKNTVVVTGDVRH